MTNFAFFLYDQNIDVLAISETRLNYSIFDQEVKVQGYDIICRDRSTNGRFGGGVCFYIRSNISYSVCTDLDSELRTDLDSELRTDLDCELLEIISIENNQ